MLRKAFPMLDTYLKSRVIMMSYKAKPIMIQIAKNDLLSNEGYFENTDPMHYYELNFISYLVQHHSVDPITMTTSEFKKYNEGVEILNYYREFNELINKLIELNDELEYIYYRTTKENSMSNFMSRREFMDPVLEVDLKHSIHKYVQLLEDLNEFPEWQQKVKSDIGNYVHLMYSNLCNDQHLSKVFEGFDKQYFFK